MDDALGVGVGERRSHRRDRRHHLARPQPAATGEHVGEAAAGQELQHQRHPGRAAPPGLVDDLDQPHQVRVVQLPEQCRLPRLPLRIPGDQHLDRDGVPAPARHCPPHLARAAPAEQLLQRVAGDDRGCGRQMGSGHDGDRRAAGGPTRRCPQAGLVCLLRHDERNGRTRPAVVAATSRAAA